MDNDDERGFFGEQPLGTLEKGGQPDAKPHYLGHRDRLRERFSSAGHLALAEAGRQHAERIVVSIFVNPTQFAAHEDLGSYPRTWKADIARLIAEGVDVVWHPDVATMYPEGFATRVAPEGPALVGLEDRFRPHFFGGAATVVAKLFTQLRPDVAFFGEKD